MRKIVFYRLEKSTAGQQSRGGSVKLWFSAVGTNPGARVVGLTPGTHVFPLWETWAFLEYGGSPLLASLVPYFVFFFSYSPTGLHFGGFFVTGTVFSHLFHTGILFFRIHLAIPKDISSRKWVSWAKNVFPSVCLKHVISMDKTNDNQPKSKPLGSKLEQRTLLTVLCQIFKPRQETVLKRTTFKIEALGAVK